MKFNSSVDWKTKEQGPSEIITKSPWARWHRTFILGIQNWFGCFALVFPTLPEQFVFWREEALSVVFVKDSSSPFNLRCENSK